MSKNMEGVIEKTIERRKTGRVKTAPNIVYIYYREKKVNTSKVINLSTKGAYLTLNTNGLRAPLGAVVKLVFLIPKDKNITKILKKSSIITRVDDKGIGIGFLRARGR